MRGLRRARPPGAGRRCGAQESLESFDSSGVVGDELSDLKLASFAFDYRPDGARDGLGHFLEGLLLFAAGDRPVRPRPDQQVADRLLIVGAWDEGHAYRKEPVLGLAMILLIILRELAGSPGLDICDR